jgi:hypothetical protein
VSLKGDSLFALGASGGPFFHHALDGMALEESLVLSIFWRIQLDIRSDASSRQNVDIMGFWVYGGDI